MWAGRDRLARMVGTRQPRTNLDSAASLLCVPSMCALMPGFFFFNLWYGPVSNCAALEGNRCVAQVGQGGSRKCSVGGTFHHQEARTQVHEGRGFRLTRQLLLGGWGEASGWGGPKGAGWSWDGAGLAVGRGHVTSDTLWTLP